MSLSYRPCEPRRSADPPARTSTAAVETAVGPVLRARIRGSFEIEESAPALRRPGPLTPSEILGDHRAARWCVRGESVWQHPRLGTGA